MVRVVRVLRWCAFLAGFAVLAGQLACIPRQRIPLEVGPGPVLLFVDGELATEIPPEIELRSDRDHKLFVKRDGYTPELVVLESREIEGRDRLFPGRVDIHLETRLGEREVVIGEGESATSE